jgi:Septum formation
VSLSTGRLATLGLATAIILTGCSALQGAAGGVEPERDRDGQVTEAAQANAFALRVGDCLNLDDAPATDAPVSEEVESVPTVPCDQEHDGEVYAVEDMDEGEFPGDEAVATAAEEFCLSEFQDFVGVAYDESPLDFTTFSPTEDSWNELDDRELLCIVVDPEGGVTGTLEGSAERLEPEPGADGAGTEPPAAEASAPRVGDCLNLDESTSDEADPRVPCEQEHDGEVYAVHQLPDGEFPGDDAAATSADELCVGSFPQFVGMAYEDSALDFTWGVPTAETWAGGDREVVCVVVDPDKKVTGSLRGAGY